MLVWLVAVAAAAQTFAQGIEGILNHRADHFVLYFSTSIILIAMAVSIESVKKFVGGWE